MPYIDPAKDEVGKKGPSRTCKGDVPILAFNQLSKTPEYQRDCIAEKYLAAAARGATKYCPAIEKEYLALMNLALGAKDVLVFNEIREVIADLNKRCGSSSPGTGPGGEGPPAPPSEKSSIAKYLIGAGAIGLVWYLFSRRK